VLKQVVHNLFMETEVRPLDPVKRIPQIKQMSLCRAA
jgi:hypothetical protein